MTLEVLIEDPRWAALDLEALADRAMAATLRHIGLDADLCDASLLACDDAHIAALNAGFRSKPAPTNVLSWPAEERGADRPGDRPLPPEAGPDGRIELGDIALSYDTCIAEAAQADTQISAHATHLIVHATLHLLGYDHMRDADGDLMETLEVEILENMGYDNPYGN